MEWLAERLAAVDGVVAVALGGSRAHGTHRHDSDWDFGLYYRGTIDPEEIRALGYPGTVVAPGEWDYPMNGSAWLTIEGEKVDLLYRNLADVERVIHDAENGEWELYRMPGYLCGMPTYTLVAELALCRVLSGTLPTPSFPARLRASAPKRWRWECDFVLPQAAIHAEIGDVAACLGKLSYAVLAEAHARLCERGDWICNEKHLAERAGLAETERILLDLPGRSGLTAAVEAVRVATTHGDVAS